MNIEMAYLLGMISGNGEIQRTPTNTIVSIDYGWRIENDETVFNMVEQALINLVNELNINNNEFVLE